MTAVPQKPYPITLMRGITLRIRLALRTRGTPVQLAGYEAKLQVRESERAPVALIDLSTENGGIAIDAATGIMTLTFSAEATANYTLPAEYDLLLKSPEGDVTRLMFGPVTATQPITKWN